MNSEVPTTDDAFWLIPGTPYEATYSLAVFHDIDFVVNEGFRRIPHGGIEVGGVLYGEIDGHRVAIRGFRPIECEHASGPSFNLSESDLAKLVRQVSESRQDPELEQWAPVGWFISHTRSPLKITAREAAIFDQIFPGPGKITVLVKPERFQPTRFGFLVRDENGFTPNDATGTAIILPLPGHTEATGNGPLPSLPAPITPAPAPSPAAQAPATRPSARITQPIASGRDTLVPEPAPVSMPAPPRPLEELLPEPGRTRPLSPVHHAPAREPFARSSVADRLAAGSGAQFAVVLLIAALLGCCVGYWAYLQLPSPVIPLSIRAQQTGLVVSWPAGQTRGVSYAALRINDGDPVMLSPTERTLGEASLSANGDEVKVELIAQHWLRDSRGIVRYIKGRAP